MPEKHAEESRPDSHRRQHPNRARDAAYIRRVLITVAIALLALALAMLLWWGIRVLLVGFAGVLVAVLLHSVAAAVHKLTRLPHGWSLGVTCLLLAGLVVGLGFVMAPEVTEQANQLVEKLPESVQKVKDRFGQTTWGRQVMKFFDRVSPGAGGPAPATQAVSQARRTLSTTVNVVVNLVVVTFLGIFLAAQPALYVNGLAELFPPSKRHRICQLMNRLGYTLRWWLIAQVVDMAIIGVLTWLALWLLGVPLALTLGILAALFNFIPNFGPLISFVPAVLLAMVESPDKAIWVTVVYIVLQSIEGYLLLPLLQRGAVDTPPALLILSQVLMTLLVGALGLALAAPLLAVVLVTVKMLYVHDVLGEGVELPGKHEAPRPGGPAL